MKVILSSLFAGTLFGAGLVVAGMTDPANVVGFLNFFGGWNPALAFVMVGAIAVNATAMVFIRRRSTPLFDSHFHIPTRTDLDPRLLAGAAIFGIGWGLGGFCPGPGLVAVAGLGLPALVFVASMSAGIWVYKLTLGRPASVTSRVSVAPLSSPEPVPFDDELADA